MARRGPKASAGKVRIVAGKWRRRLLPVLPVQDLRPSPDRIRETLFNWLGADIRHASCLDLFAGTGCLGFEAASRGAEKVVLVEQNRTLYRSLADTQQELAADCVQVVHADAMTWLGQQADPFDVVFLDPPFQGGLLEQAMAMREANGLTRPGGWAYLESGTEIDAGSLPSGWALKRAGKAGQVRYYLAST